jgi:hypothetical protein
MHLLLFFVIIPFLFFLGLAPFRTTKVIGFLGLNIAKGVFYVFILPPLVILAAICLFYILQTTAFHDVLAFCFISTLSIMGCLVVLGAGVAIWRMIATVSGINDVPPQGETYTPFTKDPVLESASKRVYMDQRFQERLPRTERGTRS